MFIWLAIKSFCLLSVGGLMITWKNYEDFGKKLTLKHLLTKKEIRGIKNSTRYQYFHLCSWGWGRLRQSSKRLFETIRKDNPQVFTSVLTIEEVLVGVYKEGLEYKILSYLEFISGGGLITVVEMTKQIAMLSAKIRAQYNVRTPDSIQLATAISSGASEFITADRRLPKKVEDLIIRFLKACSL